MKWFVIQSENGEPRGHTGPFTETEARKLAAEKNEGLDSPSFFVSAEAMGPGGQGQGLPWPQSPYECMCIAFGVKYI